MTSPKPAPRLGQAVTRFLDTLKVPKTRKNRAEALDPLVARFGAELPLADLDPADVAAWIYDRWGEFSGATQNSRTSAMRAAWTWWEERRWISRDQLAEALRTFKRVKERPVQPAEVLTPDEMEALLRQPSRKYPTGIRNKAIMTLLYTSGLRISELLALRPSDVDFAGHSIRLRETKSGEAQTRGFRLVADDALLRWMDKRRELGINGNAPLFCAIENGTRRRLIGGPLSDDYIRQILRRYAEQAGISKRIHPHAFRHSFAVWLESQGLTITEIADLLGQSGPAVTARYLKHLGNGQARKALAALDAVPEPEAGTAEERVTRLEAQVRELLEEKVRRALDERLR